MTASAAEVEAATEARRWHEFTVGRDAGVSRVCCCGFDFEAAGVTFWQHKDQAVADAVVAAAQPRIAAETRLVTFADTSDAFNLVADVWEQDGSDPCRVRVTREYANAYRLYAEGHGEPTGQKHRDHKERPVTDIDVTMCPECDQKGRYEGRILIGGRGFYQCPEGHRWQNADEKPTTKGVAFIPAPEAQS